ncbi:MAG TPA: 3-oxoacyl-ACP reductase family protein, partial [Dehalococcoidales bacterium]|nr:3-oxoacyl-ACP reductase family protein [Dehalococcoidales bacterium]
MDLTDKVAIVTGSGRGIGKAIALRLAKAGATVVTNSISDPTSAEAVAAEIKAMNRNSLAVRGDVSMSEDVTKMVETAVSAFGKVDIMVNNAGITRDHLLMRLTDDDWDRVIAVNLRSVFLCTRAVLKYMTRQRWGRIINMASVVGIVGNAGQANYAASKAGIIGFTKTVAKEVASRGITVNAIAPGFIDTQMTQHLDEAWKQEILKRIPVG